MNDVNWAMVGMNAVLTVGNVFTLLFQYLNRRSSQEFDVRTKLLERENAQLAQSVRDAENRVQEARKMVERCEQRHDEMARRLLSLEQAFQRLVSDGRTDSDTGNEE